MKILGRVDWAGTDKNGARIARVEPLISTEEAAWRPVEPEEFPAEGRVFWPQAKDAVEGSLVFCQTEPNPGQRDEHRVTSAQLAIEILDVRAWGTAEQIRRRLVAGQTEQLRPCPRALLWCGDDELVGPVRLAEDRQDNLVIESARDRIPCMSRSGLDIRELRRGSAVRYVLSGSTTGAPSRYVDWDTEEGTARRAIRFAVDRAREQGANPAPLEKLVADALRGITGSTAELKLKQYQLTRTQEFIRDSARLHQLASSIAEELLALPVIKLELDSARAARWSQIEAELKSSFLAERSKLESAREKHAALTEESRQLERRVEEARASVGSQIQQLEAELGKRVKAVLARPASFIAEAAVLQAALPLGAAAPSGQPSSSIVPQLAVTWSAPAQALSEPLELRKALTAALKARGLEPDAGIRIHATLAAGLLPIVIGPRALAALDAYGDAVCGGRSVTVHVSPALIEPGELFGRLDPARGIYVPHASGLLEAARAAAHLPGPVLVTLEGLNRAPTESFLLPLLQDIERGAAVRLFHPAALSTVGGTADHEVKWPRALRLAATAIEGSTTLPLSRELWDRAVVIYVKSAPAPATSRRPPLTELPLSSALLEPGEPQEELVSELLGELAEAAPCAGGLELYAASLARFERDKAKLRAALVQGMLLPAAVTLSAQGEQDAALATLQEYTETGGEQSAARDMIQQLRRRLA